MLTALFFLNSALLALSLINLLTLRRPGGVDQVDESVVVLLPARNEEGNIDRILKELEAQIGLTHLSILVINDNSEDRTEEIASSHLSQKISLISAPHPPVGWIGKVSALEYGLQNAPASDFIISIDADVHFSPDAIVRAVNTLKSYRLDFVSPYPRQMAHSWGERLIQPLLQWSWMSTLLLRGAEKFPLQSTVVCNGQFLAMRTDALKKIGGFAAVSGKVLDDIELGRVFVAAGCKGAVIDGSEVASTRMYSNFNEIREGYGKSLHAAFGGWVGSLVAVSFFLATSIIPFIFALTGNYLAIAALTAIIGTRLISATAASTRLRDSFLHPLSAALFIYLLYYSWRKRGVIQWKGRTL